MVNLFLAATLAATTLSLEQLRLPEPPKVTCGIRTVSVLFVGQPGTPFSFDGDEYVMPLKGEIELIAGRRSTSYRIGEKKLPLESWPLDGFGRRTVTLTAKERNAQ
ncbi:MAG TPA: hypothetical protein VGF48_24265 [Thermoanaerobaculia bacterium]|jgi:hypothetical protein